MSAQKRAKNLLWYLYLRKDSLGTGLSFENTAIYEELLAWTASTELSELKWLANSCRDKGWVLFSYSKLTLALPGIEHLTGEVM